MKKIEFPKLTPMARKRWEQLSERNRSAIINNVWCNNCENMTLMVVHEGKIEGQCLILRGACHKCGSEVARVVEPDD